MAESLSRGMDNSEREEEAEEAKKRLKELEQALEKEKMLRSQDQARSAERIAGLEAELTMARVELSMSQLSFPKNT